MNQRVLALALCAMLFALYSSARAQQAKKMPRIGAFLPASAAATAQLVEAFREGLQKHGYVAEQNCTLDIRYAEGEVERFADLATELVRSKVDVIVAGSTPGVIAAKNATSAIPIVMVTTGDPVASGLVASLARPARNVTGLTALGQELAGKRLEVLKEAVPNVTRVAVLSNPTNPDSPLSLKGVEVQPEHWECSFASTRSATPRSSIRLSRLQPASEPGHSWCCQTRCS